jgi:2-(1,2-epoxy-1,2-dihydrophenyl)acetyl-CoA isomerase
MELIEYEVNGPIAQITFNRPEAMNALNIAVRTRFLNLLSDVAVDDTVRVAIITGKGRAFSAGGDIKAINTATPEGERKSLHLHQTLCLAIRNLNKPVIAAINGHALGAGLEVALQCDIRIAARSAMLGIPVAKVGLVSSGGSYHQIIRLIGLGRALHLALTAEPINASEAERIGLVTQVVEDTDLSIATRELANKIAALPPEAIVFAKRAFRSAIDSSFGAMLEIEEEYTVACAHREEARNAWREFASKKVAK